ncbi:MAG TPA: ABC transporter ATP-binding protein [Solirubrobacterales bacterium]|nr:ABC transporter ATP-binding protein [Solirubrobacterales bacterium]
MTALDPSISTLEGETAVAESPSVALRNVTKRFDDFTAVDDLSLEFGRGEFFTLLGPSGCGKTTTLRMIAGFERPTSGEIAIEGEDVAALPPHKRPTNTVFQSYALFPHLSVEKNVAFGLRRKKVDKDEIAERVASELQRVGLAREANRRPSQLSGGMQQRVALARALVNLPKVLLLDEPLGALDLKLRKGLQVELKRIQREVGITFVYVTHDQEEALTMSDRIAVMNRGRVEQVSIPEEVYNRPTTTFVAGFIGVSNLMPATVAGPGRVKLDSGPEVAADTGTLAAGEGCAAVVRPEKLKVSLDGEGAGAAGTAEPRVEGIVESSLYLGTATQIVVNLGGEVRMTVLIPNADEAERQRLPGGGARVTLSWAPENMHVVTESPSGDVAAPKLATGEEG